LSQLLQVLNIGRIGINNSVNSAPIQQEVIENFQGLSNRSRNLVLNCFNTNFTNQNRSSNSSNTMVQTDRLRTSTLSSVPISQAIAHLVAQIPCFRESKEENGF